MMTEPNLNPATPQQPLNPDLMGYPTVEALVAAKRAGDVEAKRLFDENQKKDALLAQLITQNGIEGNPRQNVPDRRQQRPEDRLTEFGVPVDALEQVIDRRIGTAFAPIQNGLAARGQIVAQHPDYPKYEADVAQFIATDPELSTEYSKLFEASPVAAMSYAFLKFGESRRNAVGNQTQGQVPGRTDAGIPTSRSGDGRREPSQDAEIQNAFERFQKTGSSQDAAAFAKARLRGIVTDDFLNS